MFSRVGRLPIPSNVRSVTHHVRSTGSSRPSERTMRVSCIEPSDGSGTRRYTHPAGIVAVSSTTVSEPDGMESRLANSTTSTWLVPPWLR